MFFRVWIRSCAVSALGVMCMAGHALDAAAQGKTQLPECVVQLEPGVDAEAFAQENGLTLVRRFKSDPSYVVYRTESVERARVAAVDLKRDARVRCVEQNSVGMNQPTAFISNDPYFVAGAPSGSPGQWHLKCNASPDMDVSLDGLWQNNFTGQGVTIGVVDDCVQTNHPDLVQNISAVDSYDFYQDDYDPSPGFSGDRHGIAVAGVAAGRGGNGVGICGAAPYAKIAGLRIAYSFSTAAEFADASLYRSSGSTKTIHIKNHSYSISSTFYTTPVQSVAVAQSASEGVIHVFSAGNDRGAVAEDCGKKDYTSLPEVITVAAVGSQGIYSDYSCYGASVAVCAPSNSRRSGEWAVVTMDRTGAEGYSPNASSDPNFVSTPDYTGNFGGTSSAAPLVAGLLALVKQDVPALDGRWAKHLFAKTAKKVDPTDSSSTGGWSTNKAGVKFNPNYGFGMIDSEALYAEAKLSTGVTPLETFQTSIQLVDTDLPQNNATGLSRDIIVTATQRLEEVQVVISATLGYKGEIVGYVTSPSGTKHRFVNNNAADGPGGSLSYWHFTVNGFWGENPAGTWKVQLADVRDVFTTRWMTVHLKGRMGRLIYPSVVAAVTNLTVTPGSVSLNINETRDITAQAQYNNGTSQNVTSTAAWSSQNSSIASVNSSGRITALAAGSTTVRCSFGGRSNSVAVTVNNVVNAAPVIANGAGPLTVNMSVNATPTPFVAPTLSATDADHSAAQLTWSLSSGAANGTATVSGSGASPAVLSYMPDTDYSGTDSFTVRVQDSGGAGDTITINVNISGGGGGAQPVMYGGDFTGDGQPDLLLSLKSPKGALAVLPLHNSGTLTSALEEFATLPLDGEISPLPKGYKYVATADLDGDGICDVLAQNKQTVQVYYLTASQTLKNNQLFALPGGWKVIGTGKLLPSEGAPDTRPDLVLKKGTQLAVLQNLDGLNFGPDLVLYSGKLSGKVVAVGVAGLWLNAGRSLKRALFSGEPPSSLGKATVQGKLSSSAATVVVVMDANTNGAPDLVIHEKKTAISQPVSWQPLSELLPAGTPPAAPLTVLPKGSKVIGPR